MPDSLPEKFQPYEKFDRTERLAAFLMLDFIDSGFPGEFIYETAQLNTNSSRYFSKLTVKHYDTGESQSIIVSNEEIELQRDFSPEFYADRMNLRSTAPASKPTSVRGHSVTDIAGDDGDV